MGEIAEMMLDGTLCELCGSYVRGDAPGHPRQCGDCKRESTLAPPGQKFKCTSCGRKVKLAGFQDHMRDKHGAAR